MPRKALLFPALLLILLGAAFYVLQTPSPKVDSAIQPYLKGEMAKLSVPEKETPLSDHIIMLEDGTPVKLSSLKGKALLINLWASWCAPCQSEMPELASLQRELGDDDFEVVAITVDRGGIAAAKDVLSEWGVEGLGYYADPTMKIAVDLAQGALPTSFVVGKDGLVLASYRGPLKWDAPEAVALFKALKDK